MWSVKSVKCIVRVECGLQSLDGVLLCVARRVQTVKLRLGVEF